mmetsp:Transcript_32836/g.72056  ORF Transcript_32836/g.72056 Transcript_32836/m.72056 type:complete len:111 (-) Transcript_32836:139-471(-)
MVMFSCMVPMLSLLSDTLAVVDALVLFVSFVILAGDFDMPSAAAVAAAAVCSNSNSQQLPIMPVLHGTVRQGIRSVQSETNQECTQWLNGFDVPQFNEHRHCIAGNKLIK